MATYVDEPDWFNYVTVPLAVPVTDMRGRMVTFTCRTYLPLTGLVFAHYFTRSRGFKRRFGVFDTTRVTFSNNEGGVIPMMLLRGHNDPSQFHRVGLRVTYAPPPDGWNEEEAPDSGGTSRESITPPRRRTRSRSRSTRRIEYDEHGNPQHRAGGRSVSVSP